MPISQATLDHTVKMMALLSGAEKDASGNVELDADTLKTMGERFARWTENTENAPGDSLGIWTGLSEAVLAASAQLSDEEVMSKSVFLTSMMEGDYLAVEVDFWGRERIAAGDKATEMAAAIPGADTPAPPNEPPPDGIPAETSPEAEQPVEAEETDGTDPTESAGAVNGREQLARQPESANETTPETDTGAGTTDPLKMLKLGIGVLGFLLTPETFALNSQQEAQYSDAVKEAMAMLRELGSDQQLDLGELKTAQEALVQIENASGNEGKFAPLLEAINFLILPNEANVKNVARIVEAAGETPNLSLSPRTVGELLMQLQATRRGQEPTITPQTLFALKALWNKGLSQQAAAREGLG